MRQGHPDDSWSSCTPDVETPRSSEAEATVLYRLSLWSDVHDQHESCSLVSLARLREPADVTKVQLALNRELPMGRPGQIIPG